MDAKSLSLKDDNACTTNLHTKLPPEGIMIIQTEHVWTIKDIIIFIRKKVSSQWDM